MRGAIKHQIPNANNQIMTKTPIAKIPKKSKSLDHWSLMIGYYLEIGIWSLGFDT
jgi:hypothetical protein